MFGERRPLNASLTRPLWIQLRASPLAYLFPVLLGVGVWVAFQVLRDTVSYWPSAIMAVNVTVQLLGPVFAGVAAFVAAHEHRHRLAAVRLAAARPGWAFPAAECAAVMVWALLVHVAIAIVVAGYMLLTGPVGPISIAMIASGALSTVVHVALGYLVGRLFPRLYVPPLVAASAYLVAVVNGSQSGRPWYLLSPVLNELVDPFGAPRPELYWRHGVWLLGLSALFTVATLLLVDRRWQVLGTAVLAVILTASGGLLVLALDGRYYAPGVPPFDYVCSEDRITICVHPAFEKALPGLHRRFDPLVDRLSRTPAAMTRLEQRPRGVGEEPSHGAHAIHMDRIDERTLDGVPLEYFEQFLDFDACVLSPGAFRRSPLTDLVTAWLVGDDIGVADRIGAGEDLAEPYDFLRSLSPQEGRDWLADHFREFTTCRLQPEDFRAASPAISS